MKTSDKGITLVILIIIAAILITLVLVLFVTTSKTKLENVKPDGEILNTITLEDTNTINDAPEARLDENGLLTGSNLTIDGTEESKGYKITIPVGFAPCSISNNGVATKITELSLWKESIAPDINKGIVIMDKNDNEFVWIPVKEGTYERNTTYSQLDISKTAYSIESALPEDIEIPIGLIKPATDDSAYTSTVESIEKNTVEKSFGFYISRYEAGKSTGAINGVTAPISKKDNIIWDEISCEDAIKSAKAMYTTGSVRSTLITGIQWDMTMGFITGKLDKGGETFNSTIKSTKKHTGTLETSGKNLNDCICNIFDLEGNVWEYTAEKNNYNIYTPYIYRGNSYTTIGSASYRNMGNGIATEGIGFRVVLYVI